MAIQLQKQRKVWNILGLVFDEVTTEQAVDYVKNAAIENRDCFISTPNLNFVISADTNKTFFQSVVESDLSLADGMPIVWVAKLLGIPITERVAGSSLFEQLKSSAGNNDSKTLKVFFFGGQPDIARQAHERLNSQDSYLSSGGYYDPGFVSIDEMSQQPIIDYINSKHPDFIVVALGAVKGQEWILKNRNKLAAPVISHLGAVINFVAGSVKRAPISWQRFGLEWLWRIKQEPLLWKRYFFDGIKFLCLLTFKVIPLAIYDRTIKHKFLDSQVEFERVESVSNSYTLKGSLTFKNVDTVLSECELFIEPNKNVFIDISKLDYIDAAGIAHLLLIQNEINNAGGELLLSGVSKRVKKLLYLNNVQQRFNINKSEK